jgi:DNA-binding MarR family transcriptional regulator
VRDARRRTLRALLRLGPECSPADLREELGVSRQTVSRLLRRLRAEGYVVGTERRLFVTEEGAIVARRVTLRGVGVRSGGERIEPTSAPAPRSSAAEYVDELSADASPTPPGSLSERLLDFLGYGDADELDDDEQLDDEADDDELEDDELEDEELDAPDVDERTFDSPAPAPAAVLVRRRATPRRSPRAQPLPVRASAPSRGRAQPVPVRAAAASSRGGARRAYGTLQVCGHRVAAAEVEATAGGLVWCAKCETSRYPERP